MTSSTQRPDPDGFATTSIGSRGEARFVVVRLCIMFGLNSVVWAAWYATLGLILESHGLGAAIGPAFAAGALAAMVSPMLLGALGDRFLASERVLAVIHTVGGVILLLMPTLIGRGVGWLAVAGVFVYMLFFQPSIGLMNNIAFRHLGNSHKQFPRVRLFVTLGWILAGASVGWLGLSASTVVFTIAGVVSFVLAAYALTLPHTPPTARGTAFVWGDVVGAKAFVLLRDRNFAVFALCSMLTTISLGVYNTYASTFVAATGVRNVAGVLTIGQVSEVVFILTIPFVLRHFGIKMGLFAGMGMWAVRFALFALALSTSSWLVIVGIALHGICNDFFLILGAMYVDRVAPVTVAAQAQSMFVWITNGAGIFVGALLGDVIYGTSVVGDSVDGWSMMWVVPGIIAVVTGVLFAVFFRSPHPSEERVSIEHDQRVLTR